MKYDNILALRIRKIPKPADFTMDIAQDDSGDITLIVYDTEILKFGPESRRDIMWYLLTVRDTIRQYGLSCEIKGQVLNEH